MRRFRELTVRTGRFGLVVLALLLSSASVASIAAAATVVINAPSQDAFILKNQPNRVTGARNTRLRVEASPPGTQIRRGLIQFPLGAIPPGATVTKAVIELYASLNANDSTLANALYRNLESWKENTVKWNTRPEFAEPPSATTLVGEGSGFKSFDVTTDVQTAINICPTDHGWTIRDPNEISNDPRIAYISKEEKHPADIGNRPRLTVTYTPPPCTTDADCQDNNLCTTGEHCVQGACIVTQATCDDGNPCTNDVCDCAQGCLNQPICDDGFACTTDTCDPTTLECTNLPVDSVCNTDCASGSCVADPDSTTVDPITGCQIETVAPPSTPCDDGQICTGPDHCDGSGTCAGPKDCGNPTCGAQPICQEICDNCIDDNGDGLVDREDAAACGPPLANGGGLGAGDPKFKGKPILRCQKTIRAAGSQFAKQIRTRLQRCTDGVFLCLQQKPGDAECLAKARARCLKQTTVFQSGPTNLDTRLDAKIRKACGPKKPGLLPVVAGADLCGTNGLGFGSEVAECAVPGASTLLGAVTHALAEEHRCRAVQLFGASVPRANELLSLGGINPDSLPCLLDGAQGGNLGLGKPTNVLKAVVSCQKGIGNAGAKFVNQMLAAEQRCTEAVTLCIQTKPGNQKCLTKAQATCRKVTGRLFTGSRSRELQLKNTIARRCGTIAPGKAPRVALTDLRSVLGLGYDTLQSTCTQFGLTGLASLDDVSECLVRQHVCRADQILGIQTPRAEELLAIGGAVRR